MTATRFDIFEFVMSLFGKLQYGKLYGLWVQISTKRVKDIRSNYLQKKNLQNDDQCFGY